MASFTKFNSFVEAIAEKKHNLGSDTLKVALTNTVPTSANAVLADITEIAYTNLSDRTLTVSSSAQSSGTYKLIFDDLVLSATGNVATFQYVVIYNDTATNDELIGWYNVGTTITMSNGDTFTINFDGTNGLLQIT